MKIIWSGLESSGKSYMMAVTSTKLVDRNNKIYKKYGVVRPIHSNLKFSDSFTEYAKSMHVPIQYWENLDDLIEITNADVMMDEIGNYFDSRSWQDLSLNVRRWLTQGAKCGIEIYGSAQDFAQVDKSFRRLVNTLYLVQNIVSSPRPSPTRPPVKHIWGVMLVSELDPQAYDEDKKVRKGLIKIPKVHFFERKFCEIFDTTQKIKRSLPAPLIHEERHCDHCGLTKILHV